MRIYLKELSEGVNQFDFAQSAEELDLGEVEFKYLSPISVKLEVTKTGETLLMKGSASTKVLMECSRCLEEFKKDLSADLELVFQRRAGPVGCENTHREGDVELSDEELKIVEYDAESIDLSDSVRESILLALPIKPLCSENCKGLCPVCGKNLNQGSCDCQQTHIDPRWKALERLK